MSILKLKPAYKDYIWGGSRLKEEYNKEFEGETLAETWELSCHKDGHSIVVNDEANTITFDEYIKKNGKSILGKNLERFEEFPILIKLIDAKGELSIQVHPDDEYALKNENQFGKTEMWYVTDCKDGAFLYYGFKDEISKEEFENRIKNNTLLEVLNKVEVKKGDVFFIESGTIHAICSDTTIAEIQQNSNVTYRVYDYGRVDANGNQRDLHIDKALEVTNRNVSTPYECKDGHLAKCEYFTVDKVVVDNDSFSDVADDKTFKHILVVDGEGTIKSNDESIEVKKGDSLLVTANTGDYTVTGNCEILLTYID